MNNERLTELLAYLRELSHIQASGHYVNDEIKEAIRETRKELGLERVKKDQLYESRKLVFEAKLGHEISVQQRALFEAVFSYEGRQEVLFEYDQKKDMENAIEVLQGMNTGKQFLINEEVDICSVVIS